MSERIGTRRNPVAIVTTYYTERNGKRTYKTLVLSGKNDTAVGEWPEGELQAIDGHRRAVAQFKKLH